MRSPESVAYYNALYRCKAKHGKHWRNYNKRGIKFMFKNLDEFIQEVGRRPSKKHSLDRIDNSDHYCKGNVRWATRSQQRRNSRPYTIGTRKKMSRAAKKYYRTTIYWKGKLARQKNA